MKRFALYEDFSGASEKKYRVVAIVGTKVSRKTMFSHWIEYPGISAGDSLFVSHSMTLTNATVFLNGAVKEWKKRNIHASWGMIHMTNMKFVSEEFTENLKMGDWDKENVLDAFNCDDLADRTDEQIKALQEIFPKEMHNRRGNVTSKKFGF